MIKDQMDKKFGSPWHVVVGRAFSYEITYEVRRAWRGARAALGTACRPRLAHVARARPLAPPHPRPLALPHSRATHPHPTPQLRNILYLYVGGTTGVLLWKM